MALDVKLLEIPYESLARDQNGNYDKYLPMVVGKSKFLNIAGRIVIVADIDGYKQPFYLSSGIGGKKNVPAGKWYPFFGISDDMWINKLHSEDIANYYNSEALKRISTQLDAVIGDISSQIDKYPTSSIKSTLAKNFINQSFQSVTENDLPNTIKIVTKNVEESNRILGDIYKRAAFRDAGKKLPDNNPDNNFSNSLNSNSGGRY